MTPNSRSYLNRWTSPDSIIPNRYDPQSWDRYCYVGNNPINKVDPTGHAELDSEDTGMIIRFDEDENMVIINGGTVFRNPVEVAIANAISTGNPAYLNSIPRNIPGFMIGASTENACNGLGIDCGNYFRTSILIWVTGTLAVGGGRYNPSQSNTVPDSVKADALGDPDCTGCGYYTPWKFGSYKSPQKWTNQMVQRGWTANQIDEAIQYGAKYPAVNNINPNNSATRYVNPTTGRSVVIDNVTGEIIHIGGDGFVY